MMGRDNGLLGFEDVILRTSDHQVGRLSWCGVVCSGIVITDLLAAGDSNELLSCQLVQQETEKVDNKELVQSFFFFFQKPD